MVANTRAWKKKRHIFLKLKNRCLCLLPLSGDKGRWWAGLRGSKGGCRVPGYQTTVEPVCARPFSSRVTSDVSKNGCWQRTGIWANWIYYKAKEGGRTRGRAWLVRTGLGIHSRALKWAWRAFQSTSSRERRNNAIVMWPCRVPASLWRAPPTWRRGHGRLWSLTYEGGTCPSRQKSACWKMPQGENIHIDHVLRSDLFNLTRTRCRTPPHDSLAGGGRNVMNGAPSFRPFTRVKIPTRFGSKILAPYRNESFIRSFTRLLVQTGVRPLTPYQHYLGWWM